MKISLGGIFGFVKNKFTPSLKKTELFPRWWKHKGNGVTVQVTQVHKCVGPDYFGTMIRFIDPNFGTQEFSMPVEEFTKAHEKAQVQGFKS